jgi:hypothetical protein
MVVVPACASDPPPPANPPAPAPVPTEGSAVAAGVAVASATPPRENDVGDRWIVARADNGKCNASYDVTCPPGASCNPPGPISMECPKAIAPSSYPIKLTRAAGTQECTAEVTQYHSVDCPPTMHCNPPPPSVTTLKVPCPK